jgi:hypothetical protein
MRGKERRRNGFNKAWASVPCHQAAVRPLRFPSFLAVCVPEVVGPSTVACDRVAL